MTTTMKNEAWLPGENHWVARDEKGHRGEGRSPERAQERLEEAQALDVEWVAALATGPKVEGTKR